MRYVGFRRCKCSVHMFVIVSATFSGLGLLLLTLKSIDDSSTDIHGPATKLLQLHLSNSTFQTGDGASEQPKTEKRDGSMNSCATVEEMGKDVDGGFWEESLRVRKLIHRHFVLNGPSAIRSLPPEQFCRHGFVIGKASEAGFGNEMYKILTAAALSVMLNRSLIIGQTRGKYPFGDYISYSNVSFTLKEVKHLWRHNGCVTKYKRHLVMRSDDFMKPTQTNVLCSDWRTWAQPIIWFQSTTDAVAAQFFLKNVHPGMRNVASELFGKSEALQSRPNVFGELMRVLISPSEDVQRAVNWVLGSGVDPDISLHMRMLMNRSVRAVHAALSCLRKAMQNIKQLKKPRLVIVSDTPAIVQSVASNISEFADVIHFNYKLFKGNISREANNLNFRVKDWGPAPRWVAFVDFFLASRAKHAVISGAQRRVGTTYAQLIAALAAAHSLGDNSTGSSFSFLSSFQRNLLRNGLKNQIGWGHVWNRFAGPLSCHSQPDQCASTPLLPPAWWDGLWQSPIPRDIQRLAAYGIELSGLGTFPENRLQSFCNASRRKTVKTVTIL